MAICPDEKLWLVLDLDHTLLHTGKIASLSLDDLYALQKLPTCNGGRGKPDYFPHLFFQPPENPSIITKLRPFVADFLSDASEMFHLCVCTMGTRAYAEVMVSLLDPEGLLFGGRMICREDMVRCDGKRQKCLAALPCGSPHPSKVLILDDSPDVWPYAEYAANLIVIDRYNFFPSKERGMEEPILRGPNIMDESIDGGPLANVLSLLSDIYHAFSLNPRSDARDLLLASAFAPHCLWQGFKLPPANQTPVSSSTDADAAAHQILLCGPVKLPQQQIKNGGLQYLDSSIRCT